MKLTDCLMLQEKDALQQNGEKDEERQRSLRGEKECDDDFDDELVGGRKRRLVTRRYWDDIESMEEFVDDDNDSDYELPTSKKRKTLKKKRKRGISIRQPKAAQKFREVTKHFP